MALLDEFVEELDQLRALVAEHGHQRIRTRRFRELARRVVELWSRTRRELERWHVHEGDALEQIQERTAWVLGATQTSAEVREALRVLQEMATLTEDRLVRPYRESIWWDFRSGYAILSVDERPLIDEAFRCYRIQCYRAAIVLIWGAAESRLRRFIVRRMGLSTFNSHSIAVCNAKVRPFAQFKQLYAPTVEAELEAIPDAHLLAVLLHSGDLDITQYGMLAECLNQRHVCGHPGLYVPGKHKCLAQAEDVFSIVIENPRFPP
jgi:hypothetical protein